MKTLQEIKAAAYQERARLKHCAAQYHMEAGPTRFAREDQEESAHLYRMARAWMGITKGDVKKAETC